MIENTPIFQYQLYECFHDQLGRSPTIEEHNFLGRKNETQLFAPFYLREGNKHHLVGRFPKFESIPSSPNNPSLKHFMFLQITI